MKKIQCLLVGLSVFLLANYSAAGVVILVNANNPAVSLSKEDITKIFLGKTKAFPDGTRAIAVDQIKGLQVRDDFYSRVAGKSSDQMNTYWSKLIFSGQGMPPSEVGKSKDVIRLVGDTREMIGYADSSEPRDSKVKVILELP